MKETSQSRYQKSNIAKGVCRFHPNNPLVSGKTMCEFCMQRMKDRDVKTKQIVMDHYGGKCACGPCGENNQKFLTIDHINNDGKAHRQSVGLGIIMYRWLIKNNFPEGFQVLCFNCNSGRSINKGICPHMDLR